MSKNHSTKHSSLPPMLPFLKALPLTLETPYGSKLFDGGMKSPNSNFNSKFIVGLGPKSPLARSPMFDAITAQTPDTITDASFSPSPMMSSRRKTIKLVKPPQKNHRSLGVLSKSEAPSTRGGEKDDAETFKKRLTTPYKEEKLEVDDQAPQGILGGEAIKKFYSHYKKLDKVKDVNSFMQVKDAVYTSFLEKTESLNLLPSKIGFIKEKGDMSTVKLNHFRLGDKYAEVLSEGIKSVRGFDRLELSNNRITQVGADVLLSKLNGQTQVIDLSGNNIGKIGAEHLCNVIRLKNSKLIEVNLEGNKLGDYSVGQLCEAVSSSNTLTKLNLGKNFLSDNVIDKVSQMLEENSTLEELYLQWNQIKSPGGTTLVNGLKAATKLKVLDLSWNSLGQNGSQFAKSFASYIGANTGLVHLDLSHNYITKPDAIIIAEELKANHTLYGFHFHGNVGYVDFKGFLVVPDDVEESVTSRVIQPPIHSVDYHSESIKHHIGNFGEYKDVCWICEGWRPMEIVWEPGQCGLGETEPVYAHLSFEGYKGVYLPKRTGYKNVRMVPPTKFEYFYHLEDSPAYIEGQPADKPTFPLVKAKQGEEEKQIKVNMVNLCAKAKMSIVMDEDYDPIEMMKDNDIKPRVPDEPYIAPDVLVIRPPWKFPISIFRTYRADTQALLDDCFRTDFENTRISKVVKNPDELKQVRDILYASYQQLKDCYKHYAAIGAPSDIWSIPLNTYTELCQNSKIIDGKIMKLSDFDRVFIATYTRSDKEKNSRNPDRAIVRYQFLEGLVRLAENKYISNGIVQTFTEAVQMIMTESMTPYISGFDHQKWRQDRYWNENVDTVLKSYFPVIRGVFRKYYGTKTLPGQKKFMALEEFHRIINDSGLFNDNCGERDATLAFSLAMMTQVDELGSDRIFQMQFVEFLEALGRIADKYSAHAYGYLVVNPQTGIAENEIPYEKRTTQPLHIKLEGIMPFLYASCGNDVKEIWVMPDTSIFDMQEVDPKVRYTTKKKKIVRINPTSASSIEPYEGFNALQV